MSETTKWTPGPWSLHWDHAYPNETFVQFPYGYVAISGSSARRDANARLIAAAPELIHSAIAAYALLADIQHEWQGRNSASGQGVLIALRDAIAKAHGLDPQDVQDSYSVGPKP